MKYENYIEGYDGVKIVNSVGRLLTAEFNSQSPVNAFVLPRERDESYLVNGNYDGLAIKIGQQEQHDCRGFYELNHLSFDKVIDELTNPNCEIRLTKAEETAATQIFTDLENLSPLNATVAWIGTEAYSSDGSIHTTVKQWHHDANTYNENSVSKLLRAYNIAGTRFLKNSDAQHLQGYIYSQLEGTVANQFKCGDFIKFLASSTDNSDNCHIHTTPDITGSSAPRLLLSVFTDTFKLSLA